MDIAVYIGERMQIYGMRPPSDEIGLIAKPKVEISHFSEGGSILKNDHHLYEKLKVQKSELHKLIIDMQVN